jgi:hypothetical protein
MHLQGIEKVTLTALDLGSAQKFYTDWGANLKGHKRQSHFV